MDDLYTWDLWGAALLVNGGLCSDNGFEYFRAWVIAQGREAFSLARDDAEGFALGIGRDAAPWERECESLIYAGTSAYETLTGELGPGMIVQSAQRGPRGEAWDRSRQGLLGRYPRLARALG
jgi:hypothetical protein